MSARGYKALGERRWKFLSWFQKVEVGGQVYWVSREQGRAARGMYGVRGYEWRVTVRHEATGRVLFSERCDKSVSVLRALQCAGLVPR